MKVQRRGAATENRASDICVESLCINRNYSAVNVRRTQWENSVLHLLVIILLIIPFHSSAYNSQVARGWMHAWMDR